MSSSSKSRATKGPKPKVAKKPKNPQFVTLYSAASKDSEVLVKPESPSAKRLRLFTEAAVLASVEIDNNKVGRFVEQIAARDILLLRLELNDSEHSAWVMRISLFPKGVYARDKTTYSCSIDVYRGDELLHEAIDPMADFLRGEELVAHGRLVSDLLGDKLAATFADDARKRDFVKCVLSEIKQRIKWAGERLEVEAKGAHAKVEAEMLVTLGKFLLASNISRRYA